ncbi:MAG TPA: secondary thiamine-phosphate synthase enzyme YjbQ [Bordetella sp.]|jgi:secondary thiamine-phosphate synthase enzyme|nr:secondary thiamine-phosphate synthase enzyme YjbQ [Bordetella sp.]
MRKSKARALPMNTMLQDEIEIATSGRGFSELTQAVRTLVSASGIQAGVAHIFIQHTSCSLLITENADPQVRADLERYFSRLAPDGDPLFQHDAEGPDDMPAHVRAALTGASLTVPITRGDLALGTWQGIYLWEHRLRPHQRLVTVTLTGYSEPQPANDNGNG